jgi:AcrR family transcriptional regulator
MSKPTEDRRIKRSKEAVLLAARSLLVERGVAATTIESIAERSGVAKTTIYRHWRGKGEIVLDLIQEMQGPLGLPDSGTLEGDLTALALGLARGLRDSEWSAILPSLIDAAERDPELASLHRRFSSDRHDALRRIVRRARSRGEIRGDVTDEDILELIAGPLFYRRLITGHRTTAARAKELVRLVTRVATLEE